MIKLPLNFQMIDCNLIKQGFNQGSCLTFYKPAKFYTEEYLQGRACQITLKWESATPLRLIKSILLSRPEDYLSIYQSGCNLSCLKCHSWEFSQYQNGTWMSPEQIATLAKDYAKLVTVIEPKKRATAFHAMDLCFHCGQCLLKGQRSELCPGKLEPNQILLSPQGFGPARNIIAFTGGDLACQPDWYCQVARKIKEITPQLWILFETNGYALTPRHLDLYKDSGIDAFWLDIKAFDKEIHQKLTGVSNDWLLQLPEEILKRNFTLEVLSLYIPGWVETDQIKKIAQLLAKVDNSIPFTILAFFGEYKLKDLPTPTLDQMLEAYRAVKEVGLKKVRLGNIGLFARTQKDYDVLLREAKEAI
ncbi:MAG: radical SAM protein [Candidatus Aminicenantes bacterium]|nr:radical SAM protein [Candidatus Aminicenantes bacterium]